MKTRNLILLLTGCLFSLSACQAQAAEPQPVPASGVAAADLEDMQRNLAEAQKEMQKAVEEVNVREKIQMTPGNAYTTPNISIVTPGRAFTGGHRHAGSVLLIPLSPKPMTAEVKSQLCEDIRVMSVILNDAAAPDQSPGGMGYGGSTGMIIRPGFIGFGGQTSPEAIWIDGYGVVFTLEVGFPLVPLDEGDEEQPQANQEQTDEVWQRNLNRVRGVEPPDERKKDVVVYDPDRVKMLQEKLTRALRHASNIRNLGDDNRVVVVVRGVYSGHDPENQVPTSVMTLQAAKKDIDAFADEKLHPDEFTRKVGVVIY